MKGVLRSSATCTARVERDEPGARTDLVEHAARRGLERDAVVPQVGEALRRELHQDPLADPGHRHAHLLRAVGAGADDRRVADAAGVALAGPARRGGRREAALPVERHAADRPEPRVLALPRRGHRRVVEAPAGVVEVLLPVGDLGRRRDDADRVAEPRGERQRLGPREHHVRVLLEQVAGEAHRVRQQRNLGDSAGPPVARHDAGVEPRDTVGLEVGAGAGVQQRLVLERPHRGLDGVESASPPRRAAPSPPRPRARRRPGAGLARRGAACRSRRARSGRASSRVAHELRAE